jgi:hypothetical protein
MGRRFERTDADWGPPAESKKGVGANQTKRTVRVSHKTAWYLCHRIRSAMRDACNEPIGGAVEADETLVGGTVPGEGRAYTGNKAVVAGAVSQNGQIRLKVIPDRIRKERGHWEARLRGISAAEWRNKFGLATYCLRADDLMR